MQAKEFGHAGDECVIEERLEGKECSLLVFSDGKNIAPMPPTRDHKRALDNDEGLNTGGMGAFTPLPDVNDSLLEEAIRTCVQPIVDGMAAQGMPYVGVLYAGLMLTPNGLRVLEYNCRFGDPETQVVLPLLESDLLEIMQACVDGNLSQQTIVWKDQACVTVVAASGGYPGKYTSGKEIAIGELGESFVFHAGTKIIGEKVLTNGGRVLSVSAFGNDFAEARQRAYAGMANIKFEGIHYRGDIGGGENVR
jgi:phosphoribosylamine--glycine ligase